MIRETLIHGTDFVNMTISSGHLFLECQPGQKKYAQIIIFAVSVLHIKLVQIVSIKCPLDCLG